jgi:hypothetical protein
MATWKGAPPTAGKSAKRKILEHAFLARVPEDHDAKLFTFQAPFRAKKSPSLSRHQANLMI